MSPGIAGFVLTLALVAPPLDAQRGAVEPSGTTAGSIAHTIDARLIVTPVLPDRAAAPVHIDLSDTLARPRWRYPAIGAAIGVVAGAVHAHAMTRGDYVGLPVEPMYVLPPAYAAVGAFVGVLIDSADRERRARRD